MYNPKTHVVRALPDWLSWEGPNCRKTAPDFRCGTCQRAYYCSIACQKKAWPAHKFKCVNYEEMMASLQQEMPILRQVTENDLCLVCRLPVKSPVYLTCDHLVCVGCIADYKENKCSHCGQAFDYAGTNSSDPATYLASRFIHLVDSTEAAVMPIFRSGAENGDMDALYDAKKAVQNALQSYASFEQLLALSGRQEFRQSVDVIRSPAARHCQNARLHLLAEDAQSCIDLTTEGLKELVAEFKDACHQRRREDTISSTRYDAIIRMLDESGHEALIRIISNPSLHEESRSDATTIAIVLKSYLAMGKAYELLESPEEALNWYQRIPPNDTLCWAGRKPSVARQDEPRLCMEGLAATARLQAPSGDAGVAMNLLKRALAEDDCQPGTHSSLAKLQQAQGDLEGAQRTMNNALFKEAPWHKVNKIANKGSVVAIHDEERRIEERRIMEERFIETWGDLISAAKASKLSGGFDSWESVRLTRFDMFATVDEEEEDRLRIRDDALSRMNTAAIEVALEKDEEADETLRRVSQLSVDMIGDSPGTATRRLDEVVRPNFDRIKLTKQVTKWLSGGGRGDDPKLRKIFLQRITQLAAGDRSRILRKRLAGARNMTIYETYMDGNFRILWTDDTDSVDINLGLVVWFVSPHDNVSRCMEKIDEAVTRSSRQMVTMTASSLPEFAAGSGEDDLAPMNVLLDPESDTPLKLYLLRYDDISRLGSSWQPPLYLTAEERLIVETEGTVLLLGRSGTGKTVCICNRIDFDRHLMAKDSTFTGLFVARSQRICRYVQESLGILTDDSNESTITFLTFEKLLKSCEERLFGSTYVRLDDQYVTFTQFKARFPTHICKDLDPLVVWTSIKSFIKGSIEAVTTGAPLSREAYLGIGSRRCRLSSEQREKVYDVFEDYQAYVSRNGRWDDCDRIVKVVAGLMNDRLARQDLSRCRVYVDEIQDYLQAEIALFFLLCNRGGLFLAGDPAQSVVEGIEFRFEDVRSVPYTLFENEEDRRKYVPPKPLTVNRNFRSHKGILNVAGEILDRLFETFPGSAKELPKDEGLFIGPRPSILQDVKPELLKDLVTRIEGVVLLTMTDEKRAELEKLVGSNVVVLSIRDSKGLEFSDVIIVDFFSTLPAEHQKPWKLLIQGKIEDDFQSGYPELETHLKQLYTGVTRCTNHLYFAETGDSDSGQAFFRRLTTQLNLATSRKATNIETMKKSPDEWRALGVKYACLGESERNPMYWMTKARYCFAQSEDLTLVAKAELHMESIEFRAAINESPSGKEGGLDLRVIELLHRLIEAGLIVEARRVYERVLALFDDFTRENLQRKLAIWLPTMEDY